MASSKALCTTCSKEKNTYLCTGCSRRFCLPHLQDHQQVLNGQLDGIISDHDQLKQTLIGQKQNPRNSPLIEQIDRWEQKAVETIQQAARECRETVLGHTKQAVDKINGKLLQLSGQIKVIREENDFNETDLYDLSNKLTEMKRELIQPLNISIEQDSQALIRKIRVTCSIPKQRQEFQVRKWQRHAITVAGGNGQGQQSNQLFCPWGISVDQNKSVLIADFSNDRIVRWECGARGGTIIAGGKGQGNRRDQLDRPTDVIVDKQNLSLIVADYGNKRVIQCSDRSRTNQQVLINNIDFRGLAMDQLGYLYVCDREKHEVKRWKRGERNGTPVAGGNGRGDQLCQLNFPSFVFVDGEQSVYVSDSGNDRVMKWRKDAKEGVIVAGGNRRGDGLDQSFGALGVVVDRWGQLYVADFGNHRIMRWREGERRGDIVAGGNGDGQASNQLSGPTGLSFDDEGNLYVADNGNHRIQKFVLISA